MERALDLPEGLSSPLTAEDRVKMGTQASLTLDPQAGLTPTLGPRCFSLRGGAWQAV